MKLNGETMIVADRSKDVMDGIHRCTAVANTGIGMWIILVEGVPDEYFPTIDQGKSRTGTDVARVAKIDGGGHLMTAAARLLEFWDKPERVGLMLPCSNSQKLETIESNPGLAKFVTEMKSGPLHRVIAASQGAWLYYITDTYCRGISKQFWASLGTGADLPSGSPILLLRNRLIDNRAIRAKPTEKTYAEWVRNRGERLNLREILALLIKTWNAFVGSSSPKVLKWNKLSENFPTVNIPGYTPMLRADSDALPKACECLEQIRKA